MPTGPRPGDDAKGPPAEPSWPRRRVTAMAALLTLLAALVRCLARPGRPMWLDETFTLAQVRFESSSVGVPLEASGGIHRLLLRGLFVFTDPLAIDPLVAARGLSGLLGIAAIPAFYALARRLSTEVVALLAALLLAVNQFHAYYSIEARAYALAFLAVVLSTWALVELLESPRPRAALAFGLLAGLATWAHLFGALVLAAQALGALAHPRLRAARGALLGGLALGGALSVAVFAWGLRTDTDQVAWIKPLSWDQVAMVFVRLSGTSRLLLLPFLGGVLVALSGLRREGRTRFLLALSLALALVPVLLAVLVSTVKPLLIPRYLLVALPGFLLLAAVGLAALRRQALVIGATLLLAALGLREVARDHRAEPLWQPFDRVAARLLELARPGDALVVSHPTLVLTLDRELARLGRGPGPERVSPGADDPYDRRGGQLPPLVDRVRGHAGVLFVLFSEQPASERLRQALAGEVEVTADEDLAGVRLLRLARRAPE